MVPTKDHKTTLIADVDCTAGGKSLCEEVAIKAVKRRETTHHQMAALLRYPPLLKTDVVLAEDPNPGWPQFGLVWFVHGMIGAVASFGSDGSFGKASSVLLYIGRREQTPTPKTRVSIWTLLRTPGRFTTRPLLVHFTTKMSVVRPFSVLSKDEFVP